MYTPAPMPPPPPVPQPPLAPTFDGRLRPLGALDFAFRHLFSGKWHVYMGIQLIPTAVIIAGGIAIVAFMIAKTSQDPSYQPPDAFLIGFGAFYVGVMLLSYLLNLVSCAVALKHSRGHEPTWKGAFADTRLGRGIGASILVLLGFALLIVGLIALAVLAENATGGQSALFAVVCVAGFILLSPFFVLAPLYAIDRRTSVIAAIPVAFRDVARQYFRVVAALLLITFVALGLAFFTMGLARIVAVPLLILGLVYIYRSISGPDTPQQMPQIQQPQQIVY